MINGRFSQEKETEYLQDHISKLRHCGMWMLKYFPIPLILDNQKSKISEYNIKLRHSGQ